MHKIRQQSGQSILWPLQTAVSFYWWSFKNNGLLPKYNEFEILDENEWENDVREQLEKEFEFEFFVDMKWIIDKIPEINKLGFNVSCSGHKQEFLYTLNSSFKLVHPGCLQNLIDPL